MAAVFACTGTSLTAGANNGGWPTAVTSALQVISSNFTFTNLGQAGSDSNWGLSSIGTVSALHADVVLLEFSINDALPAQGISLAQSEANLRAMIDALRAARSDTLIIPMTMNPVVGAARAGRTELDAYYDRYRAVAWDLGLPVIDNYASWGAPSSSDIPDGIHPASSAVQPIIVPNVVNAFKGFL